VKISSAIHQFAHLNIGAITLLSAIIYSKKDKSASST
jgi:hypothetical protein